MSFLVVADDKYIIDPNKTPDDLSRVYLKRNAVLVVLPGYHNTSLCISANERSVVFIGQDVHIRDVFCEQSVCVTYSPVTITGDQSKLFLYDTCRVLLSKKCIAFSKSHSTIIAPPEATVFCCKNTILKPGF